MNSAVQVVPSLASAALLTAVAWAAAGPAAAQSIRSLGAPPSAVFTIAKGMSADGSTVVGYSNSASGPDRAFRWTADGGLRLLDVFPGSDGGWVQAISGDGSAVVGQHVFRSPGGTTHSRAALWNAAGQASDFGAVLSSTSIASVAMAVSSDAGVIVGFVGDSSVSIPVRWNAVEGTVVLPRLPGGPVYGRATAVSADGSVVAGYFSTYINPKDRPFRWTAGTGTVALQLPPGAVRGIARGISADGQFIVGNVVTAAGGRPVRWNAAGQLEDLGLPADWTLPDSRAANADGSVIIGSAVTEDGDRAFVWTECGGIVPLEQRLTEQGVDLEGWYALSEAHAVDASGRFVAGVGTFNGSTRPFLADLGPGAGRSPDLDRDGAVGGIDLGLMLAGWGGTGAADLDGSGEIGGTDLGLLLASWGVCGG